MKESVQLLTDEEVSRFIVDGYLILDTGLDRSFHESIDSRLREVTDNEFWHGNNIAARVPALRTIVRTPSVHGALVSLLGSDYIVHPHHAIHRSTPVVDADIDIDEATDGPPMGKGSTAGSTWHQDAQSPLARARHHLPRFLIGFYFPHDTPKRMGPTRWQAGSYLLPSPPRRADNVVMPDVIKAGTFVLVHFDMVHAGFSNRTDIDRYMVKFVFCRSSKPRGVSWDSTTSAWQSPPGVRGREEDNAWRFIWHWLRGERARLRQGRGVDDVLQDDAQAAVGAIYARYSPDGLKELLQQNVGSEKHQRVLVDPKNGVQPVRDDIRGFPRRWNERAIVMENATYALSAQGEEALDVLVELAGEGDPWIDVNVAFALGEIGVWNEPVQDVLMQYLNSSHQQVVRQAVDAIGFIQGDATLCLENFVRLMTQNQTEWLDKAVERGWCPLDQIRLNIMFACVSLINSATSAAQLEELFVLGLKDQGYSAQVALTGLRRSGTERALQAALDYAVDRSWDDTLLGMAKAY